MQTIRLIMLVSIRYCVRPNSGRIDAASTVEVQVLLQAMKEDPPADAKCRDKFLVQSVVIPDPSVTNVTQIWQSVEATAKGSIQEKKIKVSFLPAGAHTNGFTSSERAISEEPPAYGYASTTSAATPQKSAPIAGETSPSLIDQSMASVTSAAETIQEKATTAASTVVAAVPTSSEQLQRQLEDAKATILKLQEQVSEGLRQRKVTSSVDSTSTSTSPKLALQNQQVPGGVPVQIVALLCLVSFIIAWLFF